MKKLMLSIAVAMSLGNAAMAGGDIAPVTAAPTDTWSGLYLGVQTGYSWGDAHQEMYNRTGNHAATARYDLDGINGGLYAGYNWILGGQWLLGIEGSWSLLDVDDSAHPRPDNGPIRKSETMELTQRWDASACLRLGRVMGDYLPYLTGGVAWAGMNIKSHESGVLAADDDETMTGWTLGLGLEMAIEDDLHLRIQYRYTDYGETTFHPLHNNGGEHSDIRYDAHLVSIGVSYRF